MIALSLKILKRRNKFRARLKNSPTYQQQNVAYLKINYYNTKMTKIQKTYLLEQSIVDKIQQIKENRGANTATAIVIQAIDEYHKKTFKDYVIARMPTMPKTPEDKAETQMRITEIKREKREAKQMEIVEKLEGTIIDDGAGNKYCHWYIYDKNTRYQQQLPLEQLTDDLIDSQYHPSRAEVEKRRLNGTTTYTHAK